MPIKIEPASILKHIEGIVASKVLLCQTQIIKINEAKKNSAKSSAGDKYETEVEMTQLELNKFQSQLQLWNTHLQTLNKLTLGSSKNKVGLGSLVTTNHGTFFLSIGLGPVTVQDATYYVISPDSPIGEILNQKSIGESFVFREKSYLISNIE